jgi:hypothetical protein
LITGYTHKKVNSYQRTFESKQILPLIIGTRVPKIPANMKEFYYSPTLGKKSEKWKNTRKRKKTFCVIDK